MGQSLDPSEWPKGFSVPESPVLARSQSELRIPRCHKKKALHVVCELLTASSVLDCRDFLEVGLTEEISEKSPHQGVKMFAAILTSKDASHPP